MLGRSTAERIWHRIPKPLRQRAETLQSAINFNLQAGRFDLLNWRLYGRQAPKFAELVWIKPSDCAESVLNLGRHETGRVLDGEWDRNRQPLSANLKFRACESRWVYGLPWSETGVYEYMMDQISKRGLTDGCLTLSDVVARYERLDRIYEQVASEGRLLSSRELGRRGFRGQGEIYVHVGRGPSLLFGLGGIHRFALSRILGLDCIPVQVGVVHRDAVADWQCLVSRTARRPSRM